MSGEKEKKLFIETYGCQMNVADSEVIASVESISLLSTLQSYSHCQAFQSPY